MVGTQYVDKVGRFRIPKDVVRNLLDSEDEEYQEFEITLEYGKICIRKFDYNDFEKKQFVGAIKVLDSENRLVIPQDYRKLLDISQYSPLNSEVDYDSETISLWKAS